MATSFSKKRNNAFSTLLSTHASGSGTLVVQAGDDTLFPSSFPFRVTVYLSSGTGNLGQRYGTVFNVNSKSSNTFNVTVASDESPASVDQTFTVAAGQVFTVELDWTYGAALEYETAINAAETGLAATESSLTAAIASVASHTHNGSDSHVLGNQTVTGVMMVKGIVYRRQGGVSGDGSWATPGTLNTDVSSKNVVRQAGSVASSSAGEINVVFPVAFLETPNVQATLSSEGSSQGAFMVDAYAISTTGFFFSVWDVSSARATKNIQWVAEGQ